jgi:hypothetical protein
MSFDPERPQFHGLRISAFSFWTVCKSIANATALQNSEGFSVQKMLQMIDRQLPST